MNFQININKAIEAKADCLILPIFKDKKLRGATKTINKANNKIIEDFQKNDDIQGKIGQTRILPVVGKGYKRLMLVGCGEYDKYSEKNYKKALTSSLAKLSSTSHKSVISYLSTSDICGKKTASQYRSTRILAEAWHQVSYQYTTTKTNTKVTLCLSRVFLFRNILCRRYIPRSRV
jgi:leucyl aminopeptidase